MLEIPQEAAQAAIDGVDHEYVERRGFDRNAARAALAAALPVLAADIRADERRKTAEEIAAEIEAGGEKAKAYHYKAAMGRAARIARQAGESQ
jgi:hypothetical protein